MFSQLITTYCIINFIRSTCIGQKLNYSNCLMKQDFEQFRDFFIILLIVANIDALAEH